MLVMVDDDDLRCTTPLFTFKFTVLSSISSQVLLRPAPSSSPTSPHFFSDQLPLLLRPTPTASSTSSYSPTASVSVLHTAASPSMASILLLSKSVSVLLLSLICEVDLVSNFELLK
ncbi:hypothetical protein Q3G72_009093 [Acer saccharum]|nr:hypothetical protein Q3G72_009093 [Acer saccharum]